MGKGGYGKRVSGGQFDKGGGKGGKSIPSAAALEHEIALFDRGGTPLPPWAARAPGLQPDGPPALWTCSACGCRKNEMRWSRCKHCGSQWT
eukprot:2441834-Pyramimonas_sp.AAC.1